MSRELLLPEPEPDDERPLFGAFDGRRPDTPGRPGPTSTGPTASPLGAGPNSAARSGLLPAGKTWRQRTRPRNTWPQDAWPQKIWLRPKRRDVAADRSAASNSSKDGLVTSGSAPEGYLTAAGVIQAAHSDLRHRPMIGTAAGMVLLALVLVIGQITGSDASPGRDRLVPTVAALAVVTALLLGLLVTTALTWHGVARRVLPRAALRRPGEYWYPQTQVRVRRLDGAELDLLLAGTPDPPLQPGATVRMPTARPRALRRAVALRGTVALPGTGAFGRTATGRRTLRTRRLDLLAGPEGPLVAIVAGIFPAPAKLGRACDRLGTFVCVAVAVIGLARVLGA